MQTKIKNGEIKICWDLSPAKYAHSIAGVDPINKAIEKMLKNILEIEDKEAV